MKEQFKYRITATGIEIDGVSLEMTSFCYAIARCQIYVFKEDNWYYTFINDNPMYILQVNSVCEFNSSICIRSRTLYGTPKEKATYLLNKLIA